VNKKNGETKMETLTKTDYQFAIYSQNACNLSGLVHALSNLMPKIWNEANEKKKGTDYVNQHPLVTLYIEQCNTLAKTDFTSWKNAMDLCEEKVKSMA
jgi:hypothetical protein